MKCPRCKIRKKQSHHNAKWCIPCSSELRRRPAGKLSMAQERMVRRLAGTMFIKELAKKVGTSDSNLDRWAKQHGVNINAHKYSDQVVREVCEYYAVHGKAKTQRRFPRVKVRSIVERYFKQIGHTPRQTRWTASQLIEVAKMGGLVGLSQQAKHFNRPGANLGAMRSVWTKRFGHGAASVNGLSQHVARHYVTCACPYYLTTFWDHSRGARRVALWIDIERHLRSEVPDHLRAAVAALAKFQRWLHGRDVKRSVEDILRRFG